MESFSITCTTCKSRLKVKNAAAIGQVVPCPKCGGMVLIKAPESAPPPEVANAATKPVDQQEKASKENSKDFDDVESILAGKAPLPSAAVPATAPRLEEVPLAAAETEIGPTAQPPARYGLWLAISILSGVMLAVGVVIVSGWLLSDNASVAANSTAAPSDAASAANPPPVRQADEPPEKDGPPLEPNAAAGDNTAPDSEKAATAKAKAPPASQADPPEKPHPGKPQPEKPAPEKPAPNSEEDPLGIAEPAKGAKGKGDQRPSIGEDPLAKFAQVLGSAPEDPLPDETPRADVEPLSSDMSEAGGAAEPSLPRPEPREINVAARLADPLPGVEATDVPLADFLQAMSDLSTIPMTLQIDGLGLVQATSASPVTLKATQTTVGQALEEALKPLQLQYAAVDDQLIVTLPEPAGGKLQEYPVEDLIGSDEQEMEQLTDWTTSLVDPEGWSDEREGAARLEAGPKVFSVLAANRTHAKLLFFFEKLRVARGLPLKSKHDPAFFQLQTRTAQAQERLAAPITLNFSRPTLLVQIIDRLEATANVRILVDWQALATLGWNPDALAKLTVEKKPLAAALDALLAPMDLSWRVIDARTVEVTSPAAIAQRPELEWHAAGDLAADGEAADALLARLTEALAAPDEEAPLDEEPPSAVLRFDPVSRHVLALLTQPQQRHVARLLSQWNAAAQAAAK